MSFLSLITIKGGRDYSLTGSETAQAEQNGLANAEWYKTPIDRKTLKALMKRSDGPALRNIGLWLALLAVTAAGAIVFWGTWWTVPFLLVYGVLYGTGSDSRWHECGHGTAFRSRWMNSLIYELASFMMVRNSVVWRWSHTRHHTDTIIVGKDPEISSMRPPQMIVMALNVFGIVALPQSLFALARQASVGLSADERQYVPEPEQARAIWTARAHILIYAGTLAWAVMSASLLPLLLIGLPRAYGIWLLLLMGLPQHAGLDEDVLDHRLNSRTVIMNPVLRFIYMNMNYHIEHHMFPMVPFYALPTLHEAVKHDLPPPSPSLFAAWKDIIPAFFRQLKDPHYFIKQTLPPGAGAPLLSPPTVPPSDHGDPAHAGH